jgi:hypothetical protein
LAEWALLSSEHVKNRGSRSIRREEKEAHNAGEIIFHSEVFTIYNYTPFSPDFQPLDMKIRK